MGRPRKEPSERAPKPKMLSIRLSDELETFLKNVALSLEYQRGVGAMRVSRTEVVLILIAMGAKEYTARAAAAKVKKAS